MKTAHHLVPKIFVIILMLSCCINCGEKTTTNQENRNDKSIIKAPSNIITLQEANFIYDNYTKHRVSLIESYETKERAIEQNFEAARFVDFDYNTMKQYIAYIDQEAAKAGVEKVTNLRLYFANYPNKQNFANQKKVVHPRQNSIFMVPTLDKDGINYGFYIDPEGKASLITDWKAQHKNGTGQLNIEHKAFAGFSLNTSLQGNGSLTLNYGNGGPPPRTDF